MKLNALLRYGAASLVLILLVLPLVAWMKSEPLEGHKLAGSISGGIHSEIGKSAVEAPMTDLTPDVLAATYVGASGCTATGHKFDVQIEVYDRETSMFRVKNLLDENVDVKAKLSAGRLSLGKQKMGSFTVTGDILYHENPARIETKIKFDDGVGYCEESSTFIKR